MKSTRKKSIKGINSSKPEGLDLSSLNDAIEALARAVAVMSDELGLAAMPPAVRETLRAGLIQNFEVAYEQSWKFMKRWLERNVDRESVDGITRRELFRMGAENRLIDEVEAWIEFHACRNVTSHTYNEACAADAGRLAIRFLPYARLLLERLSSRND